MIPFLYSSRRDSSIEEAENALLAEFLSALRASWGKPTNPSAYLMASSKAEIKYEL